MKKTLVDLTYYSFPFSTKLEVINACYSTLGFLDKLDKNFNVFFVARTKNQFENDLSENPKLMFHKGKLLKKWQIPFRFNAFITSLKPDYVLAHGFGSAHYLCFLKLMNRKAKILLQCNGFAPKPKGFKKWVYQFSDRFIDGYLFTGMENAKSWYESNALTKAKVFEVMEGSTHFKFNGNNTRKGNSFLWVGSLTGSKDPLTILKVFSIFIEEQPSAKLTMIYQGGDLSDEVSKLIAADPKLKKSVELKGFVPNPNLEEIYNQHQYFVSGSLFEGSGYALVEAMACGCVPIVTNIPSFEYMTDNGKCGLLFEPKNETELLKQFSKTTSIDYAEYQKKVLHQFETRLSFQAIANEITSIFQSL